MEHRRDIHNGEALVHDVTQRMKSLTGKGDTSSASQLRVAIRVSTNLISTMELSFVQVPSQSGGDQSGSRTINETNVETLFGVKFTSQSDIDVFSMRIK
ncbi:hypothetical protein Tco_0406532, partial [Tanacetum coccineum]